MDPTGANELWREGAHILTAAVPLLQFAQGLAFFVLGIAIFFTTPRATRLEILRRLPLLAIFAFCEAFVAWDNVLGPALVLERAIPPLLDTALLGLGYAALLIFGLLTQLAPGQPSRWQLIVPLALPGAWLAGGLLFVLTGTAPEQVAFWGEIVARGGFALPGGLLSLWSMRSQTYRSIDPKVLKSIRGARRVTGITLGAFGLLAGLVYPAVSIWEQTQPATLATALAFLATSLLLTVCGATITYGLMRILAVLQWEIERWIEDFERNQALSVDRERIGRELHDGIIQSIYAAGLMLEGTRMMIPQDPRAASEQISQVMTSLNQTIQDIRRYIFELRGGVPESDLIDGISELLRDFRVNTLVETDLQVVGEDRHPVSVERRRHIFQIVRESLSNVARHAKAQHVVVRLAYKSDAWQLQIADDGIGLSIIPTRSGQGLRNIRERAHMLEGTLDIDSAPGQGVTVTLTVPYPKGEVP
ncbi:MAG: sensor histidine kinase [Anaerolineae bacterium]|nr:sensor histidine kinase [Anaerolineae bacterium]